MLSYYVRRAGRLFIRDTPSKIPSERFVPLGISTNDHSHFFRTAKLQGSKYGSDEHIEQIASRFDESMKQTFRLGDEMCFIQFGSVSDKDDKYAIRAGKLKLSGYVLWLLAVTKPKAVFATLVKM